MVAIIEKRDLRDFDWLTTLLAIVIASFGVWQIHNALPTESYWSKQIIGIGIAMVAFLIVAFTDYRRLIDSAPVFYVIGLVMLFLVLTPLGGSGQRTKSMVKIAACRTVSAVGICKDTDCFDARKVFRSPKGRTN